MGRRKSRFLKKHGVSFYEAESAFGDPLASVFLDEDHSVEEKREIMIAYSERQRLLVISFTEKRTMLLESSAPDARTRKNVGNTKMSDIDDELRPHYDFDYSNAKPNRFAEKYKKMVRHVGLEPDVADAFPTEESVNEALRQYLKITKPAKPEAPPR